MLSDKMMFSIKYCALFIIITVFLLYTKAEELETENIVVEPTQQAETDGEKNVLESEEEGSIQNTSELESLPSYLNLTEIIAKNVTLTNTTETANTTEKYVSCLPDYGDSHIHLVNDTELIKLLLPNPNITTKETPANCIVILFYSKFCPFSSMAAPHFNALPRAFPSIKMVAINAMWYHIFNAQNGVVGVPTLILFHNGKPVAKFNDSEYTLELFSRFIAKHTGINAEEKSFVTSADFSGPVSSVPSKEDDMLLFLSWVFMIVCGAYYFSKSKYWKWIVETVQNTWRESEAQAQHEHHD